MARCNYREIGCAVLSKKPPSDGAGLINGGFFVLSPCCLRLVDGDESAWEGTPLQELADRGQLMAFEHRGFWRPMDTLRDKIHPGRALGFRYGPLEDLVMAKSRAEYAGAR